MIRSRTRRTALVLAASCGWLLTAGRLPAAQQAGAGTDQTSGGASAEEPCSASEHRQFNFWIGTWDVHNPEGRQVGTNKIEPILGGCVLLESWKAAGPHAGHSYNIWDKATGRWHQTWVDNSGLLLLLEGGLEGDAMVLVGERPAREGSTREKITWTPISPDSVRQRWVSSADGGATWSTVFDGLYLRRR